MTQSSVKDAHNIFDQSLYLFYLYCCVSTMEEKPFLEYIERGASNIIQFLSFYFVSVLLYIFRFSYVLYNTRFSLCGGLLLSSVCHRPGPLPNTQKRNFYSIFCATFLI
jgi:hypothetical protein